MDLFLVILKWEAKKLKSNKKIKTKFKIQSVAWYYCELNRKPKEQDSKKGLILNVSSLKTYLIELEN